ncbi:hypothetical protein LVY72_10375 [Arthrobacter sp. I2-34]|uniref:Uncharacterized protein n=1 Tax=Arthrobacter hankyongi TaxID=2904801 RepID=A0ABS9L6K6_9MICC|nr:hypothetical protein [Arthrobacter hankyongi]MCG2622322.1 hypothetical protein [Arthrobacter hankyongi]
MSSITEVFVATHDLAVRRAAALDASAAGSPAAQLPDAPNARINGITDLEFEILGGIAGKAVHAEEDATLDLADVSSDSLMVAPDSMVRSLADLLTRTDDEGASLIPDVAERWAAEEDMPFTGREAEEMVRRIAELAAAVPEDDRQQLYIWSMSS